MVTKLDAAQAFKAAFNESTSSINIQPIAGALITKQFDSISGTYPDAVTEVYAFYSGGLAGLLVNTLTIIYTDSTKAEITSVVRT